MTSDMTRTEIALLLTLGMAAQAHAGRITAEAGYRDIGSDEVKALACAIEETLTDVIVGMRQPGPAPTPEEIAETMRLVAMGAVVTILGEPPSTTVPN